MNHNDTNPNAVRHSKPIPISTEHIRHRSSSFSSDSSNSPTSPPPVVTPMNLPSTQIPISSSSPILYFLSQSPSKTPATFPFRGFAPPPVLEGMHPYRPLSNFRNTSLPQMNQLKNPNHPLTFVALAPPVGSNLNPLPRNLITNGVSTSFGVSPWEVSVPRSVCPLDLHPSNNE